MRRRRRRGGGGMECDGSRSNSRQQIESLAIDLFISIVQSILKPRSKSGPATVLTARISPDCTLMMEALNQSFRGESRGEEVTGNASVHLFHRHDREPARVKPARRLAICVPTVAPADHSAYTPGHYRDSHHYLFWVRDHSRANSCPGRRNCWCHAVRT